jgi:hypothetical protein
MLNLLKSIKEIFNILILNMQSGMGAKGWIYQMQAVSNANPTTVACQALAIYS